jgi:hypothetical protein
MDLLDFVQESTGVSSKLSPQVDEVFLLKLPIIQPHFHLDNELFDAFRLEAAKIGHILVLDQYISTFFLIFSKAFNKKSRITFNFY